MVVPLLFKTKNQYMGGSQITFRKKEREKKKLQKKKAKAERREEKREQETSGKLDDMLAYVDE